MSNLNARLAQRFLALVLLPRLRYDIKQQHKLHLSLFMAMKKAAYKPGAFYKAGHGAHNGIQHQGPTYSWHFQQ